MKRTLKQRQEMCTDLYHAILDDESHDLLEYVIDEYIYKLNNSELDELEDVIANHFGEE